MLKSPAVFAAFDDADRRAAYRLLTWPEAVDRFLALWDEARALNPDVGADWEHDVECDIAVARTLHARP